VCAAGDDRREVLLLSVVVVVVVVVDDAAATHPPNQASTRINGVLCRPRESVRPFFMIPLLTCHQHVSAPTPTTTDGTVVNVVKLPGLTICLFSSYLLAARASQPLPES
jgi:hypothetical protein